MHFSPLNLFHIVLKQLKSFSHYPSPALILPPPFSPTNSSGTLHLPSSAQYLLSDRMSIPHPRLSPLSPPVLPPLSPPPPFSPTNSSGTLHLPSSAQYLLSDQMSTSLPPPPVLLPLPPLSPPPHSPLHTHQVRYTFLPQRSIGCLTGCLALTPGSHPSPPQFSRPSLPPTILPHKLIRYVTSSLISAVSAV